MHEEATAVAEAPGSPMSLTQENVMKRFDRLAGHVLQMFAAALFVAGCASPHSRMTWDDTPPVSPVMLHAVVQGPPAALARFHAEMQALFRVTNLEDAYIACLGCD